MTITPMHRISAKNVPHIATAAARSPFLRGPGAQCYTVGDNNQSVDASSPRSLPRSKSMPAQSLPMFRVEVDPLIEDVWEAARSSFENQSRAFKRNSDDFWRSANELGEAMKRGLAERVPFPGQRSE